MAKGNNESFAEAIERAQRLPDDGNGGAAKVDLPNIFSAFPLPPGANVVTDVPPSTGGQGNTDLIKGIAQFNMVAHFKRFIIGTIVTQVGFGEDASFTVNEYDDTEAYEQVLNAMLMGKAVLRYEERTITKEGNVVIALCYFTPTEKKTKP